MAWLLLPTVERGPTPLGGSVRVGFAPGSIVPLTGGTVRFVMLGWVSSSAQAEVASVSPTPRASSTARRAVDRRWLETSTRGGYRRYGYCPRSHGRSRAAEGRRCAA